MLTDRCATMCLLATLCTFYPKWLFFFQLSMTIDISCHWIHLHTSLLEGKTSHKFMGEGSNPIIRLYYTSRPVLFGMCAGNEIFYASLYLLHFTYGPLYMFYITAILCFPVAMAKSAIAIFQVLVDNTLYRHKFRIFVKRGSLITAIHLLWSFHWVGIEFEAVKHLNSYTWWLADFLGINSVYLVEISLYVLRKTFYTFLMGLGLFGSFLDHLRKTHLNDPKCTINSTLA